MEVHNMKTGWIHTTENNTDVRFAPKTLVSEILISENGPDLMTALNQMLLEKCYPVGAVYLSTVSTSPAAVIGGTWERIENKALVAIGDTPASGDRLSYSAQGELECQFVYAWKRIS